MQDTKTQWNTRESKTKNAQKLYSLKLYSCRNLNITIIIDTLIQIGHVVNKNVTKKIFLQALHDKCEEERKTGIQTSVLLRLESGFDAFETYFVASKWLNYDSTVMQSTFSNDYSIVCPSVSKEMLQKWFPLKKE